APATAPATGPSDAVKPTSRHASSPSAQLPVITAAPEDDGTGDAATSVSRNVSAPLPPSSGGQNPANSSDPTNISSTAGNAGSSSNTAVADEVHTPNAGSDSEPSPGVTTGAENGQSTASGHVRAPTITMEPPQDAASQSGDLTSPIVADRNGSRASLGTAPSPSVLAATQSRRPSVVGSLVTRSPVAGEDRASRTRSMIGLASRHEKKTAPTHGLRAWVAEKPILQRYDLTPLLSGDRVSEVWDDKGDTLVYLFHPTSGRQPSFRIEFALIAASPTLRKIAEQGAAETSPRKSADDDARSDISRHTRDEPPDDGPQQEYHMFLLCPRVPPSGSVTREEDIDMLISYRNLFAFLGGYSLVATPRWPDIYNIFRDIGTLLQKFQFSNYDGSTFGEAVESSFSSYCGELSLWDVRNNPQKMLQSLILGEQFKFYPLYHESFTHAVGRFEDVRKLAEYEALSPFTRKELEKAAMMLERRFEPAFKRLKEFDFPSLYVGIGNSSMSNKGGLVRFENWQRATAKMRKHLLQWLKTCFESWPPKSKSKSGFPLGRLVAQGLYNDMSDLYDFLVDRSSLTARKLDMTTVLEDDDPRVVTVKALKQVMSEFDRSDLPVPPAIPFDTPLLPLIQRRESKVYTKKEEDEEFARKLNKDRARAILMNSYNSHSWKASSKYLNAFIKFELEMGQGKSVNELIENRCGIWVFMYAILQSLPLLVVDAPGIGFTEGVDYFLCSHPRGGAPWVKDDHKRKAWFGVAGGGGVVSLPADTLVHSIEGIYHRSRCFQNGLQWALELGHTNLFDESEGQPLDDVGNDSPPTMHSYNQSGDYSQHSDISNGGGDGPGSHISHNQYPPQPHVNDRPYSVAYSRNSSSTYMPLPAQHFSTTQSGQYLPYTQTQDDAHALQTPSPELPLSSTGSVSPYGQPVFTPQGQQTGSQQSTTSSSSNATGSGHNGGAKGERPQSQMPLPSLLMPAGGGPSPVLSQGEDGQPMSPGQYGHHGQYPHPGALTPVHSRPQSPGAMTGAGAPAYGVTPRIRSPRPLDAHRTSAAQRSSAWPPLAQLPLPEGVAPMDNAPSRVSTYNPNASFDAILKELPSRDKKGKKK
ncbi:hypothetical protein KEM56_007120, partial [Ascosphaera pollenicola]